MAASTSRDGEEFKMEKKRLMILIAMPAAIVVVCALATSTRVNEYQTFSGFITAEHEQMGLRAVMPSSSRGSRTLPILRDSSSAGGQKETKKLAEVGDNEPLTPGQVDDKAKEWAADHPDETRSLFLTTLTGLIIGLLGVVFLLVSEISTVILVKDLDMLHYSGEPTPIEVQERAELWGGGLSAKWRPWLSIGGAVTMVIGGLVMFYPMCGVLADFGVPEAVSTPDCLTSIVLMAVVGAIGWACLLTSLCWTCTRPWAALLLCTVSLGAHISTSAASPFVILLWAVSSGFLLYWYLTYIPEAQEGYHPVDWRTPLWYGRRPPPPPPAGYYQQGYGASSSSQPAETAYV